MMQHHYPDPAESAMLTVLVDDAVLAAKQHGQCELVFHGFSITCTREHSHYRCVIRAANQLLAHSAPL